MRSLCLVGNVIRNLISLLCGQLYFDKLSNTWKGTQSAILSTHKLRNRFPHTTNLQIMKFALCLKILGGFPSCSLHNQFANHGICTFPGDPRSMPTMIANFSLTFFLNHNCWRNKFSYFPTQLSYWFVELEVPTIGTTSLIGAMQIVPTTTY